MELRIKLEGYEDRMDIFPSGEAECRISIDESVKSWSSDVMLGYIFRHLCQVLSARQQIASTKEIEK